MINASRQPFVVSAALGSGLAALFAWRRLTHPLPAELHTTETKMPAAEWIAGVTERFPWLAFIAIAVMMVWTLLVISQLAVKYAPNPQRNWLPLQIFLIAATGIVIPAEATSAYMAAWMLTLAVRQLIFSLNKDYKFMEVLRAGLFLGMIPLLYAPAVAIVTVVAPLSLVIFKRSLREAAVCAVGLLLPVPMAGFIHRAMGAIGVWEPVEAGFIYRRLWECCAAGTVGGWTNGMNAGMFAVLGIVIVGALTAIIWATTHKKGARRRSYKFVMHLALILGATTLSALIPGTTTTVVALSAVPAALLVPFLFHDRKLAAASSVIYLVILLAAVGLNLF